MEQKMTRYGNTNYRKPAQQIWAVGATVNVGFHKGLTVIEKTSGGWKLLSASGKQFEFAPHLGLFAL
jgi:hypothetical protein